MEVNLPMVEHMKSPDHGLLLGLFFGLDGYQVVERVADVLHVVPEGCLQSIPAYVA